MAGGSTRAHPRLSYSLSKLTLLSQPKLVLSNHPLGTHRLAFAVTLACCLTGRSVAEDDSQRDRSRAPKTIELSELAAPPAEVQSLIDRGKVTFFYGRKPWQEIREARERIGVTGRGKRLMAETKFAVNYSYKSRSRWRTFYDGDKRKLRISIYFREASLVHDHKIWFRYRPYTNGFWDDELVQHEFDHVRISTHSMIEKRFLEKLREDNVLVRPIDKDTTVNEGFVRKLVDDHVESVFNQMVELVSVRYKELDRQTDHGQKPIPQGSALMSWMDRANKDTSPPKDETAPK